MKLSIKLELTILFFLALGVLLTLVTVDNSTFDSTKSITEISVIYRDNSATIGSAGRLGMEQAALDLGVELRFLSILSSNSAQEQQSILSQEIDNGTQGVILYPASTQDLAQYVAASGVPIVTMDVDMTQEGAVASICPDNTALGRSLALSVLTKVPVGSTVVLIDNAPADSGPGQRLQSAQQQLLNRGRFTYVVSDLNTAPLPTADAIIAFDGVTLESAAQILKSSSSSPALFGYGSSGPIASYLEQGIITAIAAQNEFAAGYLAVETLYASIHKSLHTTPGYMDYAIVRQSNMYLNDNQKLLFPVTG